MRRDAVFNTRRRKLLRTTIPVGEGAAGVLVIGLLIGVVAWVLGQRDAFDADNRDLPASLAAVERPAIPIYKRPVKPWVEPGAEVAVTAPGAALAPYPLAVADVTWRPTGRVRAFDPSNLYEKINGEAEKFIKQGFVSMHYLVLRDASSGTELSVELYDQGDVGGSAGIFSGHAGGGRALATRAGVTYFLTTAGVIGRTGRWFFRAAADRSSPAVTAKAEALVEAFAAIDAPVATAVQAAAPAAPADVPQGLAILLRAGVPESVAEYQASNVFQFDFATDFWFGAAPGAGGARVFVHVADTADGATALAAEIAEEQSYDHEDLRRGEDTVTMRHRVLDSWFAIGARGRYVIGVEGAATMRDVEPLLARITGAIER